MSTWTHGLMHSPSSVSPSSRHRASVLHRSVLSPTFTYATRVQTVLSWCQQQHSQPVGLSLGRVVTMEISVQHFCRGMWEQVSVVRKVMANCFFFFLGGGGGAFGGGWRGGGGCPKFRENRNFFIFYSEICKFHHTNSNIHSGIITVK